MATIAVVPLVQLNVRKEPFAEQFRTTVLLYSTASGGLGVMTTSDTGSVGDTGRSSSSVQFNINKVK